MSYNLKSKNQLSVELFMAKTGDKRQATPECPVKKAPIDFIGEACSTMGAMEGVIALMRDKKQLRSAFANGLIQCSRRDRARLSAQVLVTHA